MESVEVVPEAAPVVLVVSAAELAPAVLTLVVPVLERVLVLVLVLSLVADEATVLEVLLAELAAPRMLAILTNDELSARGGRMCVK